MLDRLTNDGCITAFQSIREDRRREPGAGAALVRREGSTDQHHAQTAADQQRTHLLQVYQPRPRPHSRVQRVIITYTGGLYKKCVITGV